MSRLKVTFKNGSVELHADHIIIKREGLANFINGLGGDKFIPLSSIKAVHFRPPSSVLFGRIRFAVLGTNEIQFGLLKQFQDENSVFFSKSQQAGFEQLLKAIRCAIEIPSIENIALAAAARGYPANIKRTNAIEKRIDLKPIGPRTELTDHFLDAEFVEVIESNGQPHQPPPGHVTLGDWWHSVHGVMKAAMIILPLMMLAMCMSGSSEGDAPIPNETAGATDMAVLIAGESSAGETILIDDLPVGANEECGGKFIWVFNRRFGPGTVSLQDSSGASVTAGKYHLADGKLSLTDLSENHPNETTYRPSTRVKNITYQVGEAPDGRIRIGTKTYRHCTASGGALSSEVNPNGLTNEENRDQAAMRDEENKAQREAAVPDQNPEPTVTLLDSCDKLEQPLREIIEGNTDGKLNIIELTIITSNNNDDGTLACYGSLLTNFGTIAGTFGTSYSPKGLLIVSWRIDESATNALNP